MELTTHRHIIVGSTGGCYLAVGASVKMYRDVILVLCLFSKLFSEVGLLVGFIRGVCSCAVLGPPSRGLSGFQDFEAPVIKSFDLQRSQDQESMFSTPAIQPNSLENRNTADLSLLGQ